MDKYGIEGGCGHTDKQIMDSAVIVTICFVLCGLFLLAAFIYNLYNL